MPIRSLPMVCGLFGLALALPPIAHAQQETHEHECERAAEIVSEGHPDQQEASAYLMLTTCGRIGAKALATGMRAYTHETDLAALKSFMDQVDRWRDATILDAAITLATDATATPPARVFAVRYVLVLTHPYKVYPYAGLIAGDSTVVLPDGSEVTRIGCPGMGISEMPDLVGTPLPSDYAARIEATLEALAASSSTPADVRNAASCEMYGRIRRGSTRGP